MRSDGESEKISCPYALCEALRASKHDRYDTLRRAQIGCLFITWRLRTCDVITYADVLGRSAMNENKRRSAIGWQAPSDKQAFNQSVHGAMCRIGHVSMPAGLHRVHMGS